MNKNLKIVIFILLFIIVFLLGMLLGMQIQGKWDKAETNKSASGSAEAQIDEETGENSDNQNDASTNNPATNDTSDDSVNETAATNHVSVDRDVDYGAMDVPEPTTDDWLFTDGNKIVDADGNEVWLTGINWFGYNTGTNTFDGLWASDLNQSIQEIANHGFNVIRVPFSAELILQWSNGEYPDANFNQATSICPIASFLLPTDCPVRPDQRFHALVLPLSLFLYHPHLCLSLEVVSSESL